jgi:2-C-methyl-D-erythritol 4-phosphate cytidylyltransferase
MRDIAVIIPAGGAGKRMGGNLPKQFLRLGDQPILLHSVGVFERIAAVRQIIVAVPAEHIQRTHRLLHEGGCRKVRAVIAGGRERQDSVRIALDWIVGAPSLVLVHDAVRPLVSLSVIRRVIEAAEGWGAAVVGVRVNDTIKTEGKRGFYGSTLPRHLLWAVQTPQGFHTHLIERAHRLAHKAHYAGTDDAALVERLRIPVKIVEGSPRNLKITTRDDLRVAGLWLSPGSVGCK